MAPDYILYDSDVSLKLAHNSGSISRDDKYKFLNHRYHYDLRKHYFSACTVNIWNSLPNHLSMLTLSTCSKHA